MSFDLTSTLVIIITLVIVAFAYLSMKGKKNLLTPLFKGKAVPSLQFIQAAAGGFPPPLIDRPIVEFDDNTTMTIEKEFISEPVLEIVEDEESVLLKAAEVVVEKVQDIVTHIASNPPNPEELFSKIRAVISPYAIFHNTEYFDAINSFIAVTVERDCGIKLSKEELLQLWES